MEEGRSPESSIDPSPGQCVSETSFCTAQRWAQPCSRGAPSTRHPALTRMLLRQLAAPACGSPAWRSKSGARMRTPLPACTPAGLRCRQPPQRHSTRCLRFNHGGAWIRAVACVEEGGRRGGRLGRCQTTASSTVECVSSESTQPPSDLQPSQQPGPRARAVSQDGLGGPARGVKRMPRMMRMSCPWCLGPGGSR